MTPPFQSAAILFYGLISKISQHGFTKTMISHFWLDIEVDQSDALLP